jgi:hypothetical protein
MTTQPELLFAPPRQPSTAERIAELVEALRGRGWTTASVLAGLGFNDRELRDLVEHADGRILSFPGSPGYRLFDEASLKEINRSAALRSQGRTMLRRWIAYQRRLHRSGGQQ